MSDKYRTDPPLPTATSRGAVPYLDDTKSSHPKEHVWNVILDSRRHDEDEFDRASSSSAPSVPTSNFLIPPAFSMVLDRQARGEFVSPQEIVSVQKHIKQVLSIRDRINTDLFVARNKEHGERVMQAAIDLIEELGPDNVFQLFLDPASDVTPDGLLQRYVIDVSEDTSSESVSSLCSYWGAGRTVAEVRFSGSVPRTEEIADALSRLALEHEHKNASGSVRKRQAHTSSRAASLPLRHLRGTMYDSPLPSTPMLALMKYSETNYITNDCMDHYFIVCDSYDHHSNIDVAEEIHKDCVTVADVVHHDKLAPAMLAGRQNRIMLIHEACMLLNATSVGEAHEHRAPQVVYNSRTKTEERKQLIPYDHDATYATIVYVTKDLHGFAMPEDIRDFYRVYNGAFCTFDGFHTGSFPVGCGILRGIDLLGANALSRRNHPAAMLTIGNLPLKPIDRRSREGEYLHQRASSIISHNGTMIYDPDIYSEFASYRDRRIANHPYEDAIKSCIGVPEKVVLLDTVALVIGSIDSTSLALEDYILYHPENDMYVHVSAANDHAVQCLFDLLKTWGLESPDENNTEESITYLRAHESDGQSVWRVRKRFLEDLLKLVK